MLTAFESVPDNRSQMFGSVATSTHSIDQYAQFVGDAAIESLRAAAAPLRGARVLYLSSPAASGAVRRLLQSSVPLLADLGLSIQWQQVRIAAEYVEMDRALRRALSGYPGGWHAHHENEWWEFNQGNAQAFDEEFDIVVVHHSASVGLHAALTQMHGHPPAGVWLWHSHRDYRNATPNSWSLVRQQADNFSAAVYDYKPFIRDDAPTPRTFVVAPGVDPLSPSARPVSDEVRETILAQRGLNVDLPVIGQIVLSMRDDDPERVLDTFALVRQHRPDVQLVITNLVTDEPALAEKLNVLRQRAQQLGGVLVLSEMDRVGNVELSALREEATVLIHEGYPRGISVELLEEMWQSRPIVSARSSVAEALLIEGRTALLADSTEEQAAAIERLLRSPRTAARLGHAAHRHVARRHLITHYLANYLKVFQQVLKRRQRSSRR